MKSRATLTLVSALCLAALLALAVGTVGRTQAAAPGRSEAATVPATYRITAGWGDDDYAANIYTPHAIQIYVGDTINWRNNSLLEPHTISFGPAPLLAKLAKDSLLPVPQKAGPPQLTLNPQIAMPTQSRTYAGSGYANSGFLTKGKSWSLTFTRPGVYRYYCLIHYPGMFGKVVVHPRPTRSHIYQVQTGYGPADKSPVDAFFPDNLRIHAGDTVRWTAGFHSVAFGPQSLLQQLRKQFILPVPQKNGPPHLVLNPRVAFPTGAKTYDGTGYWTSGLLVNGPVQLTFARPGVYKYACLVHPGMDGTITVLP